MSSPLGLDTRPPDPLRTLMEWVTEYRESGLRVGLAYLALDRLYWQVTRPPRIKVTSV